MRTRANLRDRRLLVRRWLPRSAPEGFGSPRSLVRHGRCGYGYRKRERRFVRGFPASLVFRGESRIAQIVACLLEACSVKLFLERAEECQSALLEQRIGRTEERRAARGVASTCRKPGGHAKRVDIHRHVGELAQLWNPVSQ